MLSRRGCAQQGHLVGGGTSPRGPRRGTRPHSATDCARHSAPTCDTAVGKLWRRAGARCAGWGALQAAAPYHSRRTCRPATTREAAASPRQRSSTDPPSPHEQPKHGCVARGVRAGPPTARARAARRAEAGRQTPSRAPAGARGGSPAPRRHLSARAAAAGGPARLRQGWVGAPQLPGAAARLAGAAASCPPHPRRVVGRLDAKALDAS